MYIQKAEIKNIRSIEKFEIEFKNPAGWHVLIGDNGAGKSTIIRSMALVLVGVEQIQGLRSNWNDWLRKESNYGEIEVKLQKDTNLDVFANGFEHKKNFISNHFRLSRYESGAVGQSLASKPSDSQEITFDKISFLGEMQGFFSCAFGPYRRFEGGSSEWDEVYNNPSYTKLAAHLSIFDESVALTKPIKWLIGLFNTSNDPTLAEIEKKESLKQLENIKKLINSNDFLPNNSKLESVNSKGVFFKDGNDTLISVNQMSDGYRSVLSLTFELIRQLVRVYGSELVFKNIEKGEMFIDLPGVVLVDEIDAHLHPTWQTRIGQWFLKYFPKLQFIVTTHSPLVCRAAERGSIWRLAAPGSNEESREIIGRDRELLIHGNILDAISTGAFGDVAISEDSNDSLNRLAELNVKSMMGLIEDTESAELQTLRAKFPTENKIKK